MQERAKELKRLHCKIHVCSQCHGVFGGNISFDPQKVARESFVKSLDAEIVLIGQSLAQNQLRLSGIPFHDTKLSLSVGGKFLERHFNRIGYSIVPWKDEFRYVYTTDMVQCFPGRKESGSGDRIPSRNEFQNCKNWLLKELHLISPKCIILMGAPSAKAFWKYILKEKLVNVSLLYRQQIKINILGMNLFIFVLPHSSSMVPEKTLIFEDTFRQLQQAVNA